jgi:hypothetical protein
LAMHFGSYPEAVDHIAQRYDHLVALPVGYTWGEVRDQLAEDPTTPSQSCPAFRGRRNLPRTSLLEPLISRPGATAFTEQAPSIDQLVSEGLRLMEYRSDASEVGH